MAHRGRDLLISSAKHHDNATKHSAKESSPAGEYPYAWHVSRPTIDSFWPKLMTRGPCFILTQSIEQDLKILLEPKGGKKAIYGVRNVYHDMFV
jgi:hypothetical protein